MAETTSNFKLVVIGIFVVAAIVGILVFAGVINFGGSSGTTAVTGTAVLWGTLPDQALQPFLDNFSLRNQDVHITYVQKDPATFDQSLVEAIASGTPPDLVLLPDTLLYEFSNKLSHIPFTSLPAATYQSTFVSAANIFQTSDGYLALPWAADPLIFYFNRDLLQGDGIVTPPATWTDFVSTIPGLTKKTSDLSLTQSAAALGTWGNILHAKDILALLFLQNGNNFMTTDSTGALQVHFGTLATQTEEMSAEQALTFYTGFADTSKNEYTWNSGQPLDRDLFTQSKLAYYFGSASDLPVIAATNPNLNFGVALPPQPTGGIPMSTGTVYGLAIPKIAPNQLLSYTAATLLSNADSESALATTAGTTLALMPVRRDVLAQKPASDPYLALFYNVTLVMKPWLDPNPTLTNTVFGTLMEDATSGVLGLDQSLQKASGQILTQSANN